MTTAIGKIVKSNTHIDYVCQVYNPGEVEPCPEPSDYGFGAFVSIRLSEGMFGQLVGVIYNTLLMNPDFGSLGPRLSPRQDLEIFSPDYLEETATLVGVIALGWFDGAGNAHQGVPSLAASVNDQAATLEESALYDFHAVDGKVSLAYMPLLMNQNSPLAAPLAINIVDQLTSIFPAQQDMLNLMRNNLAWKSMVLPTG